ncbi:MAG: hypothetical protein LBU09_05305, partial [Endomicrobium sp.]|nr:hypothetical protein [Endomicrobium sp.]
MKKFDYWDKLYKSGQLEEFSWDKEGLLWLKLKSILRVALVKRFLAFSKCKINAIKQVEIFCCLFEELSKNVVKAHKLLDEYIRI